MKKITIIILSLTFYGTVVGQNPATSEEGTKNRRDVAMEQFYAVSAARPIPTCLIDSTRKQNWDSSANSWYNYELYVYGYDAYLNRNETKYSIYYMQGVSNRTLTVFDAQHNPTQDLYQVWNSNTNAYSDNLKRNRTFNQQNNITQEISLVPDNFTNSWKNQNKFTYTYASNGHLTSMLFEKWSNQINAWENFRKVTSTTNSSGKVLSEITEDWNKVAAVWENNYKVIYTYDLGGNMITYLFQSWNGQSTPDDEIKLNFTYDAYGNLLTALSQEWDLSTHSWVNYVRQTHTYNSHHHESSFVSEGWFTPGNTWQVQDKRLFTYLYDIPGNITNKITQFWYQNAYRNTFNELMYYNCTTVGIDEFQRTRAGFTIFPNPVQSELMVTAGKDFSGVRILNACGQEVLMSAVQLKSIAVFSLQAGIYFIQFLDKSGSVLGTEKFIKN